MLDLDGNRIIEVTDNACTIDRLVEEYSRDEQRHVWHLKQRPLAEPGVDVSDAATIGCMIKLAEQAHGRHVCVDYNPVANEYRARVGNFLDGQPELLHFVGASVAEALIVALEDEP